MIRSGTLTRILLLYAALRPATAIDADQAEAWLNNAWRTTQNSKHDCDKAV